MQHCDLGALALAGLGEPALGADDALHLAGCSTCRQELASLRRAVTSARGPDEDPPPVTPPDSVWQAVAAATGVPVLAHRVPGAEPRRTEPPSSVPAPLPAASVRASDAPRPVGSPPAASRTPPPGSGSPPSPAGWPPASSGRHAQGSAGTPQVGSDLEAPSPAAVLAPDDAGREAPPAVAAGSPGQSRRPRSWGWYAAAAAVVVAAGTGAVVGSSLGEGTPSDPGALGEPGPAGGAVVAVAELGPLPAGPASGGSARVREAAAGSGTSARSLEVDVTGLGAADGFYEVWLLDGDGGLVSLGVLPDDAGAVTLPVPAGVDLVRYSLLDVSAEPLDGDPGHSKVSVARGELVIQG